ncbi:hypothetical protein B0H16DRAFT_1307636 [Mycena metata]|uniref:DUF6589 domain-containing protein n=1 Tax=Mycena metata TaxID=1033252 RepID=A0AAD7JPE9_9AGAR|nr:hypothetical protein B0H16DRAFT_1307636 [Mycena metata]
MPSLTSYLLGGVGLNPLTSTSLPIITTPTRQRRGDSLPGSSPIEDSSPASSVFSSPERVAATRALADSVPYVPSPLPPLSSDGINPSSPIIGTKEERLAASYRKRHRKRANTVATQRVQSQEEAEENKTAIFDEILQKLRDKGFTFAQLMLYVFDPSNKQGTTRWDGFFKETGLAARILNFWVSNKNSATAREEVGTWAEDYVAVRIHSEAQSVTASKMLQTAGTRVDNDYVTSFSMVKVGERIASLARVTMRMLDTFATSARNLKTNLPQRVAKRFTVVTSAALALLGQYSHKNNYSRRIMGLYLYATGAQRQTITVMAHLGISESYQNLTHKPRTNARRRTRRPYTPPDPVALASEIQDLLTIKLSTLHELSSSMRGFARVAASTGLFAAAYDNINMVFRAAEQILGRTVVPHILSHRLSRNGTCATIFALWKARLEDMRIPDLNAAFDKAPPLSLKDILLTAPELNLMDKCLRHCILLIIIEHGGEKYERFRAELDAALPVTPDKIELHQTVLHPTPAWNIDQSTIIANAEVANAIYEELEVKGLAHWKWAVKILAGDQLSIARLRSVINIRAGHEDGYSGFGWGVWMPGLFHGKIADMHGFFVTHWGVPNRGTRNPGSLSFHNTHLHRAPILLSSLPPFRVCRDLVFTSLYSRVLHCLLLVSGKSTLDECAASVETYAQLEDLAASIQVKFANAELVSELRWQRSTAQTAEGEVPPGDQIFENSCLLLRDALISREFTDSIKAGDSGRIVLVLKLLALSFRGNGRSKYAYEMLHLIHNLTHVWPKPIRDIVLNNWLVNPTGNPFSWVEVDLMQEHMNFWIKTIYQAHGSAASWEWLGMVAPCVTALRHLSTSITRILGSDQGTKHEPADLSTDIKLLMKSLAEHDVYKIKGLDLGRLGDGTPTPDVIAAGVEQLADSSSNPLVEYNTAFQKLQARLRLRPLVDNWSEEPQSVAAPTATTVGSGASGEEDSDVLQTIAAAPVNFDLPPVDTHLPEPSQVDFEGSDVGNSDIDGASMDGFGEEELMAFERTMDEVDEPTLTRDMAADVALDMDGNDDDFLFSSNIYNDEDAGSDYYYVDDVNDLDYEE